METFRELQLRESIARLEDAIIATVTDASLAVDREAGRFLSSATLDENAGAEGLDSTVFGPPLRRTAAKTWYVPGPAPTELPEPGPETLNLPRDAE